MKKDHKSWWQIDEFVLIQIVHGIGSIWYQKGGHLVLYIAGKLIPLGFRISVLEGLKVSFTRVIALHHRVSVLGTLIFSDDLHHKYDQTRYF